MTIEFISRKSSKLTDADSRTFDNKVSNKQSVDGEHPEKHLLEIQLQKILDAGDDDGCHLFFCDMSEAERKTWAAYCELWLKKQTEMPYGQKDHLVSTAYMAAFATMGYAKLVKLNIIFQQNAVTRVLVARAPAWLDKWVAHLLDNSRYWFNWKQVRAFVREGLILTPEHPHYFLGIIGGIRPWADRKLSLEELLKNDVALLSCEIWKLFEYEGGGENSLSACGPRDWTNAMVSMSNQGLLSRERLLLSALEALERDFNQYRAKWFYNLYDSLKPTDAEMAFHGELFLKLLHCTAPNVVSWGFKKVKQQIRQKQYTDAQLVFGLEPVLLARGKGLVMSALKLLKKIAQASPNLHRDIARLLLGALVHESTDVQQAVLNVLEIVAPPNDPDFKSKLADYESLVAPSLKKRLQTLLGSVVRDDVGFILQPESLEAHDGSVDVEKLGLLDLHLRELCQIDELMKQSNERNCKVPAVKWEARELRHLAGLQPLELIVDFTELLGVCAQVLEDEASIEDVERAMDGLSRLCCLTPPDVEKRIKPLYVRAKKMLSKGRLPFIGEGPGQDMAGLIIAWATGKRATIENSSDEKGEVRGQVTIDGENYATWGNNMGTLSGALSLRSRIIEERLATGYPAPLLSAATHEKGFVDPLVLVEKVNNWMGPPPPTIDVALALLRLAPENRDKALNLLNASEAEWQNAIRYALGGDPPIGDTSALWIGARLCNPEGPAGAISKKYPELGTGDCQPIDFEPVFEMQTNWHQLRFPKNNPVQMSEPDDCIPFVLYHDRGAERWDVAGICSGSDLNIVWAQSVCPLSRQSLWAEASGILYNNIDWWEAQWGNKSLLLPLLHPGTALLKVETRLLCIGLAAKEPGEFGLAVDAAIAAIEEGRLGSDNLGGALVFLLSNNAVKLGRLAKTLGEIAQVSEIHALVVKLSLEQCLQGNTKERPRDFVKLLSLLKELSFQLNHGPVAKEHQAYLRQIKTGKSAKIAKEILTVSTQSRSKAMAVAFQQAVHSRAEWIRQWQQ